MPKKDVNQIAFAMMLQAIGEVPKPKPTLRQENGRKGGLTGGKTRVELMTPEQKSELGEEGARSQADKRGADLAGSQRQCQESIKQSQLIPCLSG